MVILALTLLKAKDTLLNCKALKALIWRAQVMQGLGSLVQTGGELGM